MPQSIIPRKLKQGDTIAFISPSARVNHELAPAIWRAKSLFKSKGYHVREFFSFDSDIQSSISNRLQELRVAFADPTVAAIICTATGSSLTELLPGLIADKQLHETIRKNPKIVVGYGDMTGLHWFLHKLTGLCTFYGPSVISDLSEPPINANENKQGYEKSALAFTVNNLFQAIGEPGIIARVARSPTYVHELPIAIRDPYSLEPPTPVPNSSWVWIRDGIGRGRLFGGSLTNMVRLGGVSAIRPDWRDRIVFLESGVDENHGTAIPLETVRQALGDLIAQGVFDEVAGLVIGRPFGYDTPEEREQYIDVINGAFCQGPMSAKQFPIVFNVDIGHTAPKITLPFDAWAILDSDSDQLFIPRRVVTDE